MQIIETMPKGWSLVELAEMQIPVVVVFGAMNDWAAYTGLPEQSKKRLRCLPDFDLSNPDDVALHGQKLPAYLATRLLGSYIPEGMVYRP